MPRKNDAPQASIRDRVLEMRRVPASELLPNPRNWRLHNDAQRRIFRDMLDRIGFAGAELARLLPDGRLMLIDGHMRQEELGDTPLPVLVTDLTEQEADALLATFDPLGRLAGTDRDAASALIESLGAAGYYAAADLLRAVADNDQTSALLESLADGMLGDEDGDAPRDVDDPSGGGDDFDTTPDESGPTRCQSGDLWQLGNHRLLCGDSTKREDVARLMDGERADMMWTDPPYGVDYVGGDMNARHRERLANDADASMYKRFLPVVLPFVDGPCYMWFAGSKGGDVYDALDISRCEVHALLIWNKTNATYAALNANYKQRHEPFMYFKPHGSTLRWAGPTTECSVWDLARDPRNDMHPTQKPLALPTRAINNHEAESVLDVFAGSGVAIIAAERLERTCYAMEIAPRYCDVILRRWEAETGREATLLSRVSAPENEPAQAAAR